MKTLQFKTNIKCGGCIATVTPHLEAIEGLAGNWQVDTVNPNKILTVETDNVSAEQIRQAVQKAGFQAEPV